MNMHMTVVELAIFELIAEKVRDVNPKDVNWSTPLHFAAKAGRVAICSLIIKKIGNGNSYSKDKRGNTPLDYADGHRSICRLFEKKEVVAKTIKS